MMLHVHNNDDVLYLCNIFEPCCRVYKGKGQGFGRRLHGIIQKKDPKRLLKRKKDV